MVTTLKSPLFMRAVLCHVLFLLFPAFSLSLAITEVHPNPIEDESLNEWVEIWNNSTEPFDARHLVFSDSQENDSIAGGKFLGEGTIIPANGFAILTDSQTRVYENFNVSPNAIHLYASDVALGNGLSNGGETLSLFLNGSMVASISYPLTPSAKSAVLRNGTMVIEAPTPGTLNGTSFLGCDYEVQIIINGSVFKDPNDFSWRAQARNVAGESTNITLRASIEDFFGNVLREYVPFTNDSITSQRTTARFSPNLAAGKSYLLRANLTTACVDGREHNNYDERIFTVYGVQAKESYLDILSILDLGNDDEASFGQIVRVRLSAYRGDTEKKAVSLWIEGKGERLTKITRFSAEEKFKNMEVTLPLALYSNCGDDFKEGEYALILEGLDERVEEDIDVRGNVDACPKAQASEPKKASNAPIVLEIASLPRFVNATKASTEVRIINNNDETIKATLWSYLYRGSASVSGVREGNAKKIALPPKSSTLFSLENTPGIKEEGDYKFKALLLLESRKTPIEEIADVEISLPSQAQEEKAPVFAQGDSKDASKSPLAKAEAKERAEIIFSSSAYRARDAGLFLFIGFLIALIAILLWK